VADKLNLPLDTNRDELLTRIAPDGKPWSLHLLVTDKMPELQVGQALRPVNPETTVQLLSPPAVAGQQNSNATVTDLVAFANCPRQYYLGYYLGLEGRPRTLAEAEELAGLSASELGTEVHALLAGSPVPDPDQEALRLAGVFRQSPLGRRLERAGRVEREFDFLMAVEDLVIRGQVDLWFEEGGELVVVDYKTDSVTAAEARRRARDYSLQLRLYALAVERFAGRAPDRAWLCFLRPNTVVEVDLTPSLLERPEQIVRDFEDAQSNLEFPLNEGERCRRCRFFRDLCPAGQATSQA
jgi:CRISPR/Cas system-associated exonuclease Cas4 (RecB family)